MAADQVMSTEEICKYLKLSRPTVLRLLHSGELRGAKVGAQWRILKSEVDAYLRGESGSSDEEKHVVL